MNSAVPGRNTRYKGQAISGLLARPRGQKASFSGCYGTERYLGIRGIKRSYLDWNATAPLRAEARSAMEAALALTGNASSVHAEGRAIRRLIEEAREQVARLMGAVAKNVIFTSGATEANML